VVQVVSVQRDEAVAGIDGQRRPGGQAEVAVDDVKCLPGVEAAQVASGTQVAAHAAGREGVDLHVEVGDPLQLAHLIAHEAAQRRPGCGGIHVRDDERAHDWLRRFNTGSPLNRHTRVWFRYAPVPSIGTALQPLEPGGRTCRTARWAGSTRT